MINIMYSRYVLTIAAFAIVLLMDVLYFSKKKISDKLSHKVYSYFIIVNTLVLIFELVIMTLFWFDVPFNICIVALKARDICLMTYFITVLLYYYSAIIGEKYKDVKSIVHSENIIKIHLAFTAVVMIIHAFLPYAVVDKMTFNAAFGGPAFFLTIAYCVVTTVETIIVIIVKSKNGIDRSVRLSLILLFTLMLIILVCQIIFYDVSVMGIVSSVYVLGLYFLFENPDLELVEEIEALTNEVDSANRSKFDFLTGISKEMMAPINDISHLTGELLNTKDTTNEKISDNIKQIEVLSKNFLELINNSLDVSHVEDESDKLSEKEYSLGGFH